MTVLQNPALRGWWVRRRKRRLSGGAWWLAGGIDPADVAIAYQPKGAASQSASYVNLADPGTYNAAPGVVPAWSGAAGWTFDGATQWLDIGYIPVGANQTYLIQFSGLPATPAYGTLFGVHASVVGAVLVQRTNSANGFITFNGTTSGATNTPFMAAGNYGMAGKTVYRNGVAEPNAIPAGDVNQTASITIGAGRVSGTVIQFVPITVSAFVAYRVVLTPSQVAAVAAAMAAS